MKVVLELQDQLSNIKKVTVRHDIIIGRGAECNLRLSAPQVSRRHCFLRVSKENAFVSDLESSNGTFLNGNRLSSGQRFELVDGATLSIGPVKFIARVRSEVSANEALQVEVSDDRIETETSTPSDSGSDYSATIASSVSPFADDAMNFAIEHAGPSADEDEHTSDYVATPVSNSSYFSDDDEITSPVKNEQPLSSDDDPTTVADAEDVLNSIKAAAEIIVDPEDMLIGDDEDITEPGDIAPPVVKADSDEEQQLRDFLNGLD